MGINNYFSIFDFTGGLNDHNNSSQHFAWMICCRNQEEMQSIVNSAVQRHRKDFDFSEVPTAYLMLRLNPDLLPTSWQGKEVYRTCNRQQWEKAILDGRAPDKTWIIEQEFPVELPSLPDTLTL